MARAGEGSGHQRSDAVGACLVDERTMTQQEAYCGGSLHMFTNDACVHKGGTDTDEQPSKRSLSQKPGHITSGNTHM